MKLNKEDREILVSIRSEYVNAYNATFAEERRLDEEYKRKLNEIRAAREELRQKYVSIERIMEKL